MVNICNSEQHVVLMRILDARNRPSITPDMPLWKLKLTEEEYTNLKETLVQNAYRLEDFGIEAALCYAEWWRRDYNGGIPSREDVAVGLGLPHYCWEQLYKAARHGLKSHGFAFIHSLKGNEYFRTLLNQGGLPVNYIKNGTNLSGFSRFLIGLVEELSSINIDWDDNNIDLIKNFNCIAYLGKAFKNDNIYDVSLQIAHAIISEEDRWLPYDDTDSSLSELTKSLKREYRRVKSEHRTKPLSLSWKLRLTSSKTANLFVNLNIVKEISSKSIEGLNYQSCYTFDVFVSGILVGKYVRKSLVGLTATPIRKDGLQPIIFMQCGPIRFSADAKAQIQKQSFQRYLVPRFTSYRPVTDDKQSFTELSQSLAESEIRNNLIVEDVLNVVAAGRTPIILTARTSHVELLAEMLKQHIINIIQLTGEGSAKNKRETLQKLQDIPKDAPLVIVATGKYVGEGFDYPRLDTLLLALPISWKGLVAQYAGRLHRENEGKKDVRIYDYIDIHEPVCENMYRKRLKGYSAIGYRVLSKDTQTLFDNTDDLQTSSYEGQIFNGNTFRLAFMQNLKSSRQSIVISSPKLYHTERNTFVKMLRELHASGVQVAILTSEESSQTNYLKSLGLYVKIVPKLSLSSCIIDRSTVWYGSINILGYVTEEDNIIKITDGKLANELLDVIYNSGK